MGDLTDETKSLLAEAYVGEFFIEKYRRQAAEKGMRQVALNLKTATLTIRCLPWALR